LRHPGVVSRDDVEPPRADDVVREERLHEIGEPVRVHPAIRICIGDDLTTRRRQAGVARGAQPAVRHVDDAHAGVPARQVPRALARTVVDDDDLR
jgi:hypothetical protein